MSAFTSGVEHSIQRYGLMRFQSLADQTVGILETLGPISGCFCSCIVGWSDFESAKSPHPAVHRLLFAVQCIYIVDF